MSPDRGGERAAGHPRAAQALAPRAGTRIRGVLEQDVAGFASRGRKPAARREGRSDPRWESRQGVIHELSRLEPRGLLGPVILPIPPKKRPQQTLFHLVIPEPPFSPRHHHDCRNLRHLAGLLSPSGRPSKRIFPRPTVDGSRSLGPILL